MKYLGATKLSKLTADNLVLKEEDKIDLKEYAQISDEADAVLEAIKEGFERLRLTTLTKR